MAHVRAMAIAVVVAVAIVTVVTIAVTVITIVVIRRIILVGIWIGCKSRKTCHNGNSSYDKQYFLFHRYNLLKKIIIISMVWVYQNGAKKIWRKCQENIKISILRWYCRWGASYRCGRQWPTGFRRKPFGSVPNRGRKRDRHNQWKPSVRIQFQT